MSSQDNSSNNKRIAKNTIMLYLRMFLTMIVGLYTSRVVLSTLGVEDYGIYGVVGGVVGMFSFLNAAMSGATSRFLTFEMGKGDYDRLCKTFSSALIVHIGLALIVLVLAETVGLWFLCHKMVIPEERMLAAHIVYQCSIFGSMLTITQVPYNAAIISHEKMDIYAYVELLNTFLKLGIVYLLVIGNFDKLILYSLLMLGVNITIAMTYRVYCLRHFAESKFRFNVDKEILRPMLSFSSWNVLSECGYSFRVYGSNIVLNMFFGPIVNAAGSIATTVQSVLLGLVGNVVTAVRPQIIINYGQNNLDRMNKLMISSIRLNLLLVSLITIPVIVDTPYLVYMWLGQVPEYAISFCRLLLFAIYITSISQIVTIGIHASGNIKLTSIVRNVVYISTPIVIYITMRFFIKQPVVGYIIILISQMIACLTDIYILHRNIKSIKSWEIFADYVKSIVALSVILGIMFCFRNLMAQSLLRLVLDVVIECILIFILFWLFMFRKAERELILEVLKKIKSRI